MKTVTAGLLAAILMGAPLQASANGGGWGDAGGGAGGAFDGAEGGRADEGFLGAKPMTAKELQDTYNDAVTLLASGDFKRAARKFEAVSDHAPNNADVWNYVGYSLRKSGNAKKGEMAYKKALRLAPNHPRANQYYGELLVEQNRIPEAEERLAVLNACCANAQMTKDLAALIADAKAGKALSYPNKLTSY